MQIKMTITLHMNEQQLRDWANEYGLSKDEAPTDATEHLGGLVHAAIKQVQQVEEFTTVTGFTVK